MTERNTAITVAPTPPADSGGFAGLGNYEPTGIIGVVVALAGGILWLRRKLSTDTTAITGDSALQQLIKDLQKERSEAMTAANEAWNTRMADVKEIARLTAEVTTLTRRNQELEDSMKAQAQKLKAVQAILLELAPQRASEVFNSNFGELR